jgi:hypothetical protein
MLQRSRVLSAAIDRGHPSSEGRKHRMLQLSHPNKQCCVVQASLISTKCCLCVSEKSYYSCSNIGLSKPNGLQPPTSEASVRQHGERSGCTISYVFNAHELASVLRKAELPMYKQSTNHLKIKLQSPSNPTQSSCLSPSVFLRRVFALLNVVLVQGKQVKFFTLESERTRFDRPNPQWPIVGDADENSHP